MIEVRVVLKDANEREAFNDFMKAVEQYRYHQRHPQPQPAAEPPAAEGATEQVYEAEYAEQAPAEVIATITPEGVTRQSAAPKMPYSEDDMVKVTRAFLAAYGIPKTKQVLAEFGVEKATDEMAPEKQQALYTKLSQIPAPAGAK